MTPSPTSSLPCTPRTTKQTQALVPRLTHDQTVTTTDVHNTESLGNCIWSIGTQLYFPRGLCLRHSGLSIEEAPAEPIIRNQRTPIHPGQSVSCCTTFRNGSVTHQACSIFGNRRPSTAQGCRITPPEDRTNAPELMHRMWRGQFVGTSWGAETS